MKSLSLLYLTCTLAQAASVIHTGFNYGAFWGETVNVKHKDDFLDSFTLAKNLDSPVPFDSARLFSCITTGTRNETTGAFDAAVESKTKLLLGSWITPGKRGDAPDEQVNNEMVALEKGFQKHGQALADLVIGLSVGSEDIYRWEQHEDQSGLSADVVSATIDKVKKTVATSSFGKYMNGKPVGHVDTAQYAVVKGADFHGMTAYPYWNKESIENTNASFFGSLEGVKQRAGNIPVWIAEMGWPVQAATGSLPGASLENMQQFWTQVGCPVISQYTTFWFELLKDSTAEQPDWGMVDVASHQPRIKLDCPEIFPSASQAPVGSSEALPSVASTTQHALISTTSPTSRGASPSPKSSSLYSSEVALPRYSTSTVHINTTIYVTISPTPSAPEPSSATQKELTTAITTIVYVNSLSSGPAPTTILKGTPWCVTIADMDRNGRPVTIAGGPAGSDGKCSTPTTYGGHVNMTSGASIIPTELPKDRS